MLITNGTVLTFGQDPPGPVIDDGAVYYEDDNIVAVGPSAELVRQYPDADRLDAGGKIIMPGNICAHTHFYGAFARGMAVPGEPPKNFIEVLEKLWWKVDRALTLEDCKYSALVALVDAVRHGTTTLVDHHASPNAIDGSLDAIGQAVTQAGLRASLCYEVTDRNGKAGARAGIAENVRWIKKVAGLRASQDADGRKLGAAFGLHAAFTVDNDTLEQCLAAIDGLEAGFHIHVAEDRADQDHSQAHYNRRVVERLEQQGVLGPRTLAAHCVHVNPAEIGALKTAQTNVSHQPRSNMNNAVGVAPVLDMLDRELVVGLGNDGFSNNMFTEMHAAYLLHKSASGDPRVMGGDQVMTLAFANNARIAGLFFEKPVGQLVPGAFADIILLDYAPYTPLTGGNYPWQIIFGMDGSHVTHTICGGRMLMADRQLLTLDEEAIAARAGELAQGVWQRVAGM
ncbi:MAG: putative aminohydrolase SsnA [Anaerolineae bacterium]